MSRTISSPHSRDTISSSKPLSKCVTFRIPSEKLHQLTNESEAKQVSLNTLFNQVVKEHLDMHALAPRAKLYYMPKPFLLRLINEYSEKELTELARETAKNDLVDISLFLSGEFSIASVSDIAETWLRISKMPYRYETNGDSSKIIIQHEMGPKYSYLMREICRYLLEVAFEAKASYNVTDDTLVIEADIFKR